LWFHLDCFIKKKDEKRPKETGEIEGFDVIKHEDQGRLIHLFKLKDAPPMIKSPKGGKAEMKTSITITPQNVKITVCSSVYRKQNEMDEEENSMQDSSFVKRLLLDEFQDDDFIPSAKPKISPKPIQKVTAAAPPAFIPGKQICKYGLECYRKV
jgi:hypothetical protein